ncbi:thyroid transcription factor 1-associated protein 26 isoform X1 [Motacilla alba alba]|uniref:thyroid transcription factor 1-associated protein 26 isoform X1 n=1 Tax=Motacilla alba alba TaxID=1094192 RepID=UPI0018D5585D|nr:thyroid transcription factor 1-associated protein 26 isoform X1 [Motacilla alba alba]
MAAARRDGPGPAAAAKAGTAARGPGRKRRWRPVLLRSVVGSVQEGRGFAFRRKQKVERQYRKLLKKRRQVHSQQHDQFTDTYPEHLKHLYLAEEEKLKRRRRTPDDSVSSEEKLNKAAQSVGTQEKFKNKTSNQKAKEEYEKIKAEHARKKEAFCRSACLCDQHGAAFQRMNFMRTNYPNELKQSFSLICDVLHILVGLDISEVSWSFGLWMFAQIIV